MSKRAERRRHAARMKAKARRVARDSWGYSLSNHHSRETVEAYHDRSEKWAEHLAMCSGYCCGNPRKWFKYDTRQEEKFRLGADEQEAELD